MKGIQEPGWYRHLTQWSSYIWSKNFNAKTLLH